MQTTLSPSKPQRVGSPDWPQGALPPHWIDSLLTKFEVYYGDKFHRQWANVPRDAMRKQWAIDLGQLKREELAAGVEALKREEWPPTLPGFIALCKPPANYSAALYEAIEQMQKREEGRDQWSDPAFFWAAIKIGNFDLRSLPHKDLLKRFTDAMEKVLAQETIEPVPPRHAALPAPGQGIASKEKVEAEVAKIRATTKVPGNKDWAKRILEREKRDKVPFAVGQMARRALGLDAQYKGEGK
jgi:hypothetical protein